jgi:acyl-CoA thioesterase I
MVPAMRALALCLVGVVVMAAAPPPAAPAAKKPLAPMPLLSRGAKATSEPGGSNAETAVDGLYKNGNAWAAGNPSEAKPSTLTIDLAAKAKKVLVAWTASGSSDHKETTYGGMGAYRLETSADGKSWKQAVAVKDNTWRTRSHLIDFAGLRYLRLVVTGKTAQTYEYGVQLDEVDVHDASAGADDTWFFLGDSITAGCFTREPSRQPSFAERIAAKHPGRLPVQLNGGNGHEKSGDGLERLPKLLAAYPEVKHWAIGLGTNDAAGNAVTRPFERNLEDMVALIQKAGRVPVIARIPFSTSANHKSVASFNAAVDAVTKKHGLVPGPDLYAYFKDNPGELEDGLHPNSKGCVALNRLWAEAVEPLY